MKRGPNYRWYVIGVFFVFMLLHQADKLLIGPLTTSIMEEFKISKTQMGAVTTGALIVGAIFYPIWGYLYDRYARPKLLAAASFIWGVTTWLNSIAPSYGVFLITRSSTGIDDSSYPGLYSMVSDYFGPKMRGRIYGLLNLTSPVGYLLGMILGLVLGGVVGWRGVFLITGSLGILLSGVIFTTVKDTPRGSSEPEMEDLKEIPAARFQWQHVGQLFKNRTLILLFTQGFFGVFPWNAITYWFFNYLETERGYSSNQVLVTMVAAVLVLAAGYPIGGALGDRLFRRTHKGRLIVSTIGVITGAVLWWITLNIPLEQTGIFMALLMITALFIPLAAPNVLSTVFDITLPEVRSSAQAISSFFESSGAALSPLIVGAIADATSLKGAFLIVCTSTWVLCAIFFLFATRTVEGDVKALRTEMRNRADAETLLES